MDDPMELHDGVGSDGASVAPDLMDIDDEVIDTSDIEELDWVPDADSERAASPTNVPEEVSTPSGALVSGPSPTRASIDPPGLDYAGSPLTQLPASSQARELSPLGDDDAGLPESQDPNDLSHSDPSLYLALQSSPERSRKLAPFPMLRSSPPLEEDLRRSVSRTSSPEPMCARSVGSPDFFSQIDPPLESPKRQQTPPSLPRNPPRPPTPPLVIPPEDADNGRRTLRPRRQEQIKPYTLDERQYNRVTAAVPEARVDQSEVVGEDMQEAQIHDNSRDDDYREPAEGERRRHEGQRRPREETDQEEESEDEYVDEDESQEDLLPDMRREERLQEIKNKEREREHRPQKRRKTAHVPGSSTLDENLQPGSDQERDRSRIVNSPSPDFGGNDGPSPSTSRRSSNVIAISDSDDEVRSSQTLRIPRSRAAIDRKGKAANDELAELERHFKRMLYKLSKMMPAFMAMESVNEARAKAGLGPIRSKMQHSPAEPNSRLVEVTPIDASFDNEGRPLEFIHGKKADATSSTESGESDSGSEEESNSNSGSSSEEDNEIEKWRKKREVPQEVNYCDVLAPTQVVRDFDRVNTMLARTGGKKSTRTKRKRAPAGSGQSHRNRNAAQRPASHRDSSTRDKPNSHRSTGTPQSNRESIQQRNQPKFLITVRTAGADRGGQQTYLNLPRVTSDQPESSRHAQERESNQRLVTMPPAAPDKRVKRRDFMRHGELYILPGAYVPVEDSKGRHRVVRGQLGPTQYQQFLTATTKQPAQSPRAPPSAGGASARQSQLGTYMPIPPPRRSIVNATARPQAPVSQRHGQAGSIRLDTTMPKPVVLLEVPEDIMKLSTDFGIKHLSADMKFVDNSKLMQSGLAQLIDLVESGNVSHPEQIDYYFMDLHLNKDFTGDQLYHYLPKVFNSVFDWIVAFDKGSLSAIDRGKDFQRVFDWLVCFLAHSADADIFFDSLVDQALAFVVRLEDDARERAEHARRRAEPTVHLLAALWFCVELATVACFHPSLRDKNQHVEANAIFIRAATTRLVMQLLGFGFERTMEPLLRKNKHLDPSKPAAKAIECWICLIHTLETIKAASIIASPQSFDIWTIVVDHWQVVAEGVQYGLHRGELIWRSIFGLCAISQFSSRGISSRKANLEVSSSAVMAALEQLELNDSKTGSLNPLTAATRDALVRVLLNRCNEIHQRSILSREQTKPIVRYFMEIFRLRDYSNLIDEEPQFPRFIEEGDRIAAVTASTKGDSTFAVLLQFCLRVWEGASPAEVHWLASTAPIIPLRWNKDQVPSHSEQSKYINRISTCIVVIWLLPGAEDLGRMLAKARSYLNWVNVHPKLRMLVIRALMLIGANGKRMSLSLDKLFEWADEMVCTLLEEVAQPLVKNSQANRSTAIRGKDKRKSHAEPVLPRHDPQRDLTALWLVLGSLVELKTEDGRNTMSPKVLNKHWVALILNDKTDRGRVNLHHLHELFKCVFRCWRAECGPVEVSEFEAETQEDPMAPMDDVMDGMDEKVYQMASTLLPLVRDFVASRFTVFGTNEASRRQKLVDLNWVDILAGLCWICAAKETGPSNQKWAYFIETKVLDTLADADSRPLVRARFIFAMLCYAPHKYPVWREKIIMSLLSSLAYYTPTFEHQFLTLVLKLDDGRTPLLQTDYFRPGPDLNITIDELGSKRIGVLNGMLRQCDQLVVAASEAEPENTVLKGKSVRLSQTVTEMLRLVKAQNASQPATDDYNEFARALFSAVRSCPRLSADRSVKDKLDSGFR